MPWASEMAKSDVKAPSVLTPFEQEIRKSDRTVIPEN